MATPGAVPPAPTLSGLTEKWSAFAGPYERLMQIWSLPLAQSCISQLRLGTATAVVEVACGPGWSIPNLCARLPSEATYVCTDFVDEMLQAAERNNGDLASRVTFAQADAQALPFPDGSFDRYLACLGLQLIPSAAAGLAEARRVLKPGGVAAMSFWGRKDQSPMFTLLPDCQKKLGLSEKLKKTPVRSNFYLGSDDAALKTLIEAAGFHQVITYHVTCPLPVTDGLAFADNRLGGMPNPEVFKAKLTDAEFEALRQAIAAAADEIVARGDPLALDAIVAIAVAK